MKHNYLIQSKCLFIQLIVRRWWKQAGKCCRRSHCWMFPVNMELSIHGKAWKSSPHLLPLCASTVDACKLFLAFFTSLFCCNAIFVIIHIRRAFFYSIILVSEKKRRKFNFYKHFLVDLQCKMHYIVNIEPYGRN